MIAICELSVGDGRMTTAILSALHKAQVTCAEISEVRISQLQGSIEADPILRSRMPKFVQCNFDLDFQRLPEDAFDVVIALDIMEHVLDVFGFMENCHRMLKAGGVLFLRVPNIAYVKHRLRLLLGEMPITASWFETPRELTAWREKHSWDGGHLHLFTIPILRKLLYEEGFLIDRCQDAGARLESLRNVWPNLLFANPLIVAAKV